MNKLFKKISVYIDKYLNSRVIYALDLSLSIVSSLVTLLLLNTFSANDIYDRSFAIQWMTASTVIAAITIFLSRSYRVIIRHSTTKDLGKLMLAAVGKDLVILVLAGIIDSLSPGLCCALAVDFFLTFFLFGAVRLMMIYAYDAIFKRLKSGRARQNILVYGLSDKSATLLPRLEHSKHYNVLGFISVSGSTDALRLYGLPVFHTTGDECIAHICAKHNIDAILFATADDARAERDGIVKSASEIGVLSLIAPSIDEIPENGIIQGRLREIHIEDLLGRDEIKISVHEILAGVKDKVVMVTGAAGSIGSELCRQLATFGIKQLILFDNAESPMHALRLELEDRFPTLNFIPVIGDVRQKERLDFAFRKFRPQIVFHAAAYKHVPLMEENPCEAVLVNVVGSRQVADKCIEYDAEKMVMISTDKAVNPTNIMGCTKRLAEIYVQSLGLAIAAGKKKGKTKFVTTRFGNVLGSNGSVIPRFREQIEKGGPITVTDPRITRFFMTIPEACRLVMEAATISTGNQIMVFDMGSPVKIDDLARKMIGMAGYVPDKDIMIEYIGLRPGEKLYEEVLSNCENTEPTSHKMIRVARVREYDYEMACEGADDLERLSKAVNIPDMVRLMKDIVPEFKSKNSKFEEFDH